MEFCASCEILLDRQHKTVVTLTCCEPKFCSDQCLALGTWIGHRSANDRQSPQCRNHITPDGRVRYLNIKVIGLDVFQIYSSTLDRYTIPMYVTETVNIGDLLYYYDAAHLHRAAGHLEHLIRSFHSRIQAMIKFRRMKTQIEIAGALCPNIVPLELFRIICGYAEFDPLTWFAGDDEWYWSSAPYRAHADGPLLRTRVDAQGKTRETIVDNDDIDFPIPMPGDQWRRVKRLNYPVVIEIYYGYCGYMADLQSRQVCQSYREYVATFKKLRCYDEYFYYTIDQTNPIPIVRNTWKWKE